LALSVGADAADVWASAAVVGEVNVRVHWVSGAELIAVARSLGKRADGKALGFSVLRKNGSTGAYLCDIYLPHHPKRVQDRATASLGHEMAHCLGLSHE
jgi:hypothetical protein